jgi:hypothetical protein
MNYQTINYQTKVDEDEGSSPHGEANPGKNFAGKKSNDQRMPSGDATIPAPFPSKSKSCHNAHRVTGETKAQEVVKTFMSLRAPWGRSNPLNKREIASSQSTLLAMTQTLEDLICVES